MNFELPRVFMLIDVGMRETLSGTALFFLCIRCLWLSNVPQRISSSKRQETHMKKLCTGVALMPHTDMTLVLPSGWTARRLNISFDWSPTFTGFTSLMFAITKHLSILSQKLSFRDSIVLHSSNSLSAFDTVDQFFLNNLHLFNYNFEWHYYTKLYYRYYILTTSKTVIPVFLFLHLILLLHHAVPVLHLILVLHPFPILHLILLLHHQFFFQQPSHSIKFEMIKC